MICAALYIMDWGSAVRRIQHYDHVGMGRMLRIGSDADSALWSPVHGSHIDKFAQYVLFFRDCHPHPPDIGVDNSKTYQIKLCNFTIILGRKCIFFANENIFARRLVDLFLLKMYNSLVLWVNSITGPKAQFCIQNNKGLYPEEVREEWQHEETVGRDE